MTGATFGGTEEAYAVKHSRYSSHGQLLSWFRNKAKPGGRVLDIGCSDGAFGAQVRDLGFHVTGIDIVDHVAAKERLDEFYRYDANAPIQLPQSEPFDVVVLADVLEHVVQPEQLLTQTRAFLAPGAKVFVSVPNFAHWYPRLKVASGRFDYDERGILDRGHVRFFTRKTIEKLFADQGFVVVQRQPVGTPFELLVSGSALKNAAAKLASVIDRGAVRVWPTMFGYQFLYELTPAEVSV